MYNPLDTHLCSNFSLSPSIKISVKTKFFSCGFLSQLISRVFKIIIIFWSESRASCFYFAFICLCYIICFSSYHAIMAYPVHLFMLFGNTSPKTLLYVKYINYHGPLGHWVCSNLCQDIILSQKHAIYILLI